MEIGPTRNENYSAYLEKLKTAPENQPDKGQISERDGLKALKLALFTGDAMESDNFVAHLPLFLGEVGSPLSVGGNNSHEMTKPCRLAL